jgi:hypothetical protein
VLFLARRMDPKVTVKAAVKVKVTAKESEWE